MIIVVVFLQAGASVLYVGLNVVGSHVQERCGDFYNFFAGLKLRHGLFYVSGRWKAGNQDSGSHRIVGLCMSFRDLISRYQLYLDCYIMSYCPSSKRNGDCTEMRVVNCVAYFTQDWSAGRP